MRPTRLPLFFTTLLFAIPTGLLFSQTVVVTTLEDVTDFGGTQQVVDLPGPDGQVSFREALVAANNTVGPQTVEFAIPMEEWWLSSELAWLKLVDGAFVVTDDDTVLDFSSQTAFTGDTNPDGTEVGIYGLESNGLGAPAIILLGSRCTVRGLGDVMQRGWAVSIWGGVDHRIVGCATTSIEIDPYPGVTSGNVIGGTGAGEGNVLDSIGIFCGASDNLVLGNALGYIRVVGSPFCPTPFASRNRIGGPTPAERNVFSGAGSYSSEGSPRGENILVDLAEDTLIEGNYIGLTPDGSTLVPQVAPVGIRVVDSRDTTVRDNVIAGLRTPGIIHFAGQIFGKAIVVWAVNGDQEGVVIEGNLIGTDATGTVPIPTHAGIDVSTFSAFWSLSGVRIGGTGPGQGNRIAYTELEGVAISGTVQDTEVSGNAIFGNGALDLDLGDQSSGPDGPTPNDALDADVGANGLQNFPILTLAEFSSGLLHVRGRLDSAPLSAFRLELFQSQAPDVSGFGQGEHFLGALEVATDGAGAAIFELVLPAELADGRSISATATNLLSRATSEFGPAREAADRPRGLKQSRLSDRPH